MSLSRPQSVSSDVAAADGRDLPDNIDIQHTGPGLHVTGFAAQLQYIVHAVWTIVRYRRTFDFIYLPYVFFPGFVFILLGRVFGLPVVARVSGQEVSPNDSLAARLRFFSFQFLDAVIALNRSDYARLVRLGVPEDRVHFVPNGVDVDRFAPPTEQEREQARLTFGVASNERVISYVGILCKRKGVTELLDAVRRVREGRKEEARPLRVVLAGPLKTAGEGSDAYLHAVRDRIDDMSTPVDVLGKVDNVPTLLAASDLFVLPSYAEGMPNVLLEAMSTGRACIGTDISGIREVIVDPECGLLVPPGDIAALADAIATLTDSDKQLQAVGKTARDRIETHFAISQTSAMYRDIFSDVGSHGS